MKNLTHEFIVKYLTSFLDQQGYLNIVMELCDCGSLSSYVQVMTAQQYYFISRISIISLLLRI